MEDENKLIRALAVQRFRNGEAPESICTSLGKSRSWLYKWIARQDVTDSAWNEERSRCPQFMPNRTAADVEEIGKTVRLSLYTRICSVVHRPGLPDIFYALWSIFR